MTGADGAVAGNGVYLNNTSDVRLAGMQLSNFQNSGIRGFLVTGFSLEDSVISGTVGNNTGEIEGAIAFGHVGPAFQNGLFGNSLIDNVDISGSIEHQLEFYNQSGTMNLTISNSNIHNGGVDGIQMEFRGTAQTFINIDNNELTSNGSQGIQISTLEDSSSQVTIRRNTVTRGTQGNEGILLQNGGNADLTALIGGPTAADGNTVSGFGGVAIFVGQVAGQGTAQSLLQATIQNNTVTSPASATNHAILAFVSSLTGEVSQARFLIDRNTVNYNSDAARAILVDAPDSGRTPEFYATVTNNIVTSTNANAVTMISIAARNGAIGHSDVRGNQVNMGPSSAIGLNVREASPGTNVLARGGSASNDAATVLAFNNPGATTTVLPTSGDIPVVENNTILLPATPTLPSLPLLAAVGGVESASGEQGEFNLTQAALDLVVGAAISWWATAGLSATQIAMLQSLDFDVADLSGDALAYESSGGITIDSDAAGFGWFVDATPFDDFEFGYAVTDGWLWADPAQAPAGDMDLLTAVMHEMGHALGLGDTYAGGTQDNLMYGYLVTGERRLPGAADAARAGFDYSAAELVYGADDGLTMHSSVGCGVADPSTDFTTPNYARCGTVDVTGGDTMVMHQMA